MPNRYHHRQYRNRLYIVMHKHKVIQKKPIYLCNSHQHYTRVYSCNTCNSGQKYLENGVNQNLLIDIASIFFYCWWSSLNMPLNFKLGPGDIDQACRIHLEIVQRGKHNTTGTEIWDKTYCNIPRSICNSSRCFHNLVWVGGGTTPAVAVAKRVNIARTL